MYSPSATYFEPILNFSSNTGSNQIKASNAGSTFNFGQSNSFINGGQNIIIDIGAPGGTETAFLDNNSITPATFKVRLDPQKSTGNDVTWTIQFSGTYNGNSSITATTSFASLQDNTTVSGTKNFILTKAMIDSELGVSGSTYNNYEYTSITITPDTNKSNEGWRVGEPGLALSQSSLPVDLELGLAIIDGDNDYVVSEFTVEFDPSYNNTSTPIAIDLDRSGSINYLTASPSLRVAFDDQLVETAWIAPSDALLVYDANNSGGFDDYSEIALTSWGYDPQVQTDLEALDAYFNLNDDGVFDSTDTAWSDFGVWTDLNLDGVQQEGEFTSLDVAGIESIGLNYNENSQSYLSANGQAQIFGQITVTYSDGTNGLAEDVAFSIKTSEANALEHADDTTKELILGETPTLSTADLVNQFLKSNPVEDAVVSEIHQDLIHNENNSELTEPDSSSKPDSIVEAESGEIHENDLEFDIELADITTTDVIVATQHDGVDDHSSSTF